MHQSTFHRTAAIDWRMTEEKTDRQTDRHRQGATAWMDTMWLCWLLLGLCPDWPQLNPKNAVDNAKKAMDAAEKWMDVPQVQSPLSLSVTSIQYNAMAQRVRYDKTLTLQVFNCSFVVSRLCENMQSSVCPQQITHGPCSRNKRTEFNAPSLCNRER